MNRNYIIIIEDSGEILVNVNCPEDHIDYQYIKENKQHIEVDAFIDSTLKYVDVSNSSALIITDKSANPTTLDKLKVIPNGVDAIQVTDIPLGAKITLGNLTQEATETTATLSFDIAGTYKFKVILFPYLDYEVEIDAT